MRITEIELEIEDLEWYGVDDFNRIAYFVSGGSKMVPEFICESRENLRIVSEYFESIEAISSDEVIINPESEKYPRKEFIEECKSISRKGLYCFDIVDETAVISDYGFVTKPTKPLLLEDLPEQIRSIVKKYILENANFVEMHTILVNKAYV